MFTTPRPSHFVMAGIMFLPPATTFLRVLPPTNSSGLRVPTFFRRRQTGPLMFLPALQRPFGRPTFSSSITNTIFTTPSALLATRLPPLVWPPIQLLTPPTQAISGPTKVPSLSQPTAIPTIASIPARVSMPAAICGCRLARFGAAYT